MLKKLSSVKNNLKSTPVRKNIPSKANIFGATKKHLTSSFVKSYNFQQKSFFGSVNKSHSINNFNQRSNFQKSWNKSLNQTISKPLFQKNFYFNNKNASMHTFSLTKKYTQTPQKYQLQHYKLTEKVSPLSINLSSRFTLPKTNFTLFQNNNNNHFQTRFFSAGPPELTKEEVTTRVIDCVKNFEKVDGTMEVTPETHFQRDLGLDSLDVVEIGLALEETFAIEIPDQDAEALHTVGDCITYIFNHPRAK